jgi:CheY-like chemotaxis protein
MINVDLIILDIMMPSIDGIELCSQLRQNMAIAGTPIIMLSAREDLLTQQNAFDAGANMFVGKSYGCSNLINTAIQVLAL